MERELKRVPLNFNWPIDMEWMGYLNPYAYQKCSNCRGLKMYNEIEILKNIKCVKTKMDLILLFIEEYSGWLQHLKSVGSKWGADGEEYKANKEAVKARKYIDLLKEKLFEISLVRS